MFSAGRIGVRAWKGAAAPAYPSIISSQAHTSSAAATSHSITLPPDVQAGDLLICFASIYSYNSKPTVSSGWNNDYWGYISSTLNLVVCYKVATGDDALTITTGTTSRHITAVTYRVSNANTVRLIGLDNTASGTTAVIQSLTSCVAHSLTIVGMGLQTAKVCTAGSSGYSTVQRATAGTSQCETACCYDEDGASGTRAPGAFTVSSTAKYVAFTVEAKLV